ncbi:hypothetical protein D3C81_944920 [compost metagenome]
MEDIDFSRRKINEWSDIYGVKLVTPIQDDRLVSEFEWAYFLCSADYLPNNKDFERFSEMENRAMELKRDVFMGASIGEKQILNSRYIETEWCRKRLNVL